MCAVQVAQPDGPRLTSALVILASSDTALRQRLALRLKALRWTVREAGGGAEATALAEDAQPEALIVDRWLPDLEVGEFLTHIALKYAGMDLLRMDGTAVRSGNTGRSPRRNELLLAIRELDEPTTSATLPVSVMPAAVTAVTVQASRPMALPEMVGESPVMLELFRMIRLVSPRSATVLIEGETGTGKEVVAKAVHRLSSRCAKPFVVLNCAAIPESLLEAELFGHSRGAFTGAVQSRTGRIEAAHHGTLFLDEIGEMPLALQAKMLRFLESGELQRVGENEMIQVDVRVVAATHQPLESRAEQKTFRLDLYHRLAVFPIEVPALRERLDDLPLLVNFFLEQMGKEMPRKRLSNAAMARLMAHSWPGNVRELMHVLERGMILAENRPEIELDDLRLRPRSTAFGQALSS